MKSINYIITILFVIFSCTSTDEEAIPFPPSNLDATVVSNSQINLIWSDNSTNESGFKIERKSGTDIYSLIGTTETDVTNYSDKGLIENITYSYRAYSYNSGGKSPTYTNEVIATTKSLPKITTAPISSIQATKAKSGGTITFDGGSNITARGIVWNTSINPTIGLSTKTIDGSGVGSFESTLTLLIPNTTYYVRAYSTNEFGTSYGNEVTFSTEKIVYYTAIAGGEGHSLAIKTDGTLWAWGYNNTGQLGDGTKVDKNIPIKIGSGYAMIAAGRFYSLAIKTDGTLWAWGANDTGQLGDGTNVNKNIPVQIGSGYAAIAAGDGHSLAIKTDGTLWAWGFNNAGQLGDGTNVNKIIPVQIGTG